jgi:hypothetical protein
MVQRNEESSVFFVVSSVWMKVQSEDAVVGDNKRRLRFAKRI